jgi:hypothetical protein
MVCSEALALPTGWTMAEIMGPLGASLASIMFFSGFGVAREIIKRRSVGKYSPFPYVVQIMNCSMWVIYATAEFHTGTMFWPLACNVVGLLVASCIYSTYFINSSPDLRKAWLPSIIPFLMIAASGLVILWTEDPQLVAGWGSSLLVVNVVMYGGPLAGIRRAIETSSTEFLPLSLGFTKIAVFFEASEFPVSYWHLRFCKFQFSTEISSDAFGCFR